MTTFTVCHPVAAVGIEDDRILDRMKGARLGDVRQPICHLRIALAYLVTVEGAALIARNQVKYLAGRMTPNGTVRCYQARFRRFQRGMDAVAGVDAQCPRRGDSIAGKKSRQILCLPARSVPARNPGASIYETRIRQHPQASLGIDRETTEIGCCIATGM